MGPIRPWQITVILLLAAIFLMGLVATSFLGYW